MSRLPNASALISLQEAADYAGYCSVSTLRKATRTGQLQVIQPSPRVILTTQAWVDAYDFNVGGKGGRPRGLPLLRPKSGNGSNNPPLDRGAFLLRGRTGRRRRARHV